MRIDRNNYETFLIEKLEGQLTTEQLAEVDLFLHSNPDIMQEWEAFSQTILVPDESIVFEHKQSLKKQTGAVLPLYRTVLYVTSLAASLLLLFFVAQKFFFTPVTVKEPVTVASNKISPSVSSSSNSISNNFQSNKTNNSAIQYADNSVHVPSKTVSVSIPVSQTSSTEQNSSAELKPLLVRQTVSVKTPNHYSLAYYTPIKGVNVSSLPTQSHRASEAGEWMQVASILGAEIVRLSGRGEWVNSPAPLEVQIKDIPLKKQVEETYSRIHKLLPFIHKKKSIHK